MEIGFIGAGKVGCTLGKYLSEQGVPVSGYYSRSAESAKWASEFTNSKYFETLEDILASSDALFLTVPDGAIDDVWNSLRRYSVFGKCICHCSGAVSSKVFSGIDRVGAFGYSIHPLFAIHSRLDSYRDLSQAFFTIEGSEKYLKYWCDLFKGIGNQALIIETENKELYHCAAVCASNLVTGLFDLSTELLQQCGFDSKIASEAIMPLFVNNCMNIQKYGAAEALTGPVERGDMQTVKSHMNRLSGEDKEIYKGLTLKLANIAKNKHPDRNYDKFIKEICPID